MIYVYTDGSIKGGNPGGHTGAGVLISFSPEPWPRPVDAPLRVGRRVRELSVYLGRGTNNTAELGAVLVGLRAVKSLGSGATVVTDSQYVIGVLTQAYQVRHHRHLVDACMDEIDRLGPVDFQWVKGHSQHFGNEAADRLAKMASASHESRAIKHHRNQKIRLAPPATPAECLTIDQAYA